MLVRELRQEGARTKRGNPIDKGALYKCLNNPVYIGVAVHKGTSYPGEHEAIIDRALWDKVRTILAENARTRSARARAQTPTLLKGLIFGPTGAAMSPTHTRKGVRLYRYYVSQDVLKRGPEACPVGWVPAAEIEAAVVGQLCGIFRQPEIIVGTWRAARTECDDISEAEAREALLQLDPLWDQLFPAEQARIVQLMVERVDVAEDGVGVRQRLHQAAGGDSASWNGFRRAVWRTLRRGAERPMCGFVCLWNVGDEALALRMVMKVAHRGPDAVQVARLEGGPAIMGHCRLSIIGPQDGAQPIYQGDDILVANGEIYNYSDLRAILGESLFETASDSETILHLFRSKALRWIARLDGMFAFVLATPERVIAARDPFGIKPLYVAQVGQGQAFASELKAFDGLGLSEVATIPPGTLYDSRDGWRQWYRTPHGAAAVDPRQDPAGIAKELRLVLEEAVEKWMVADVEVGAFLSGGLDSSIISAIAARVLARKTGRRLRTFAVGTEGSPDLAAARRVAAHIGSDHKEHCFTVRDLVDALPRVIYHLESADVDLVRSAMPTFFAARLARRRVKVVLTGEGADELFAGYAYHHAYVDDPRALADELTRSLGTMHNINLQRVDRISMSQSLEARTPFLDRTLIDFAQSIPAELKMRRTEEGEESTGKTTEKWILRKACDDLLPTDLVWRKKAQFDEGSGTVAVLEEALRRLTGEPGRVDREQEAALYERILREQFVDAEMVLSHAGRWEADRVLV